MTCGSAPSSATASTCNRFTAGCRCCARTRCAATRNSNREKSVVPHCAFATVSPPPSQNCVRAGPGQEVLRGLELRAVRSLNDGAHRSGLAWRVAFSWFGLYCRHTCCCVRLIPNLNVLVLKTFVGIATIARSRVSVGARLRGGVVEYWRATRART